MSSKKKKPAPKVQVKTETKPGVDAQAVRDHYDVFGLIYGLSFGLSFGLSAGLSLGLSAGLTKAALLFEEKGTRGCLLSNI